MLLPDKALLASVLHRYRAWELLVFADPEDPAPRRRLEDITYTLCVLMGQRTVREAIAAAESYLGPRPSPSRRHVSGCTY